MIKTKYFITLLWFSLVILIQQSVYADQITDQKNQIMNIFQNWTDAFNRQDLKLTCDLFSKDLQANYQGTAQKNYQSICDGFKKVFSDDNKQYHYDFKIHHVFLENNLAAVRITWYLTISENNKVIEKITDQGLDILTKNANGAWKIINYLGYPEK